MMPELRDWLVTVRLDAGRTRDHLVKAHSQWSAGWLYRQLHPGVEVIGVREARR